MIDFRKSWLGVSTFFTLLGSSWLRALLPALIAGALSALIEALGEWDEWFTAKITGNQPFQLYFWIVSFSTVFRVQHSYGRYVEARRHFQVYVCVCVCACERESVCV